MLSAASNTRFPAFSHKENDRHLSDSLAAHEVRLSSYQEPPLRFGAYTIKVEQTLKSPNEPSKTYPLSLKHELLVPGPKFRLLGKDDVHSVYPAPGHADHCNTLAHVVFTDPTVPWERTVGSARDKTDFNPVPWLAVLSFTEEELVLSEGAGCPPGFGAPSRFGTVVSTAQKLKDTPAIAAAIKSDSFGKDYKPTDDLDLLLIQPTLFKDLFADCSNDKAPPKWTGKPDLRRYAYMAHVREVHGGFMASTTDDNPEKQCAIVVSLRTGPPAITERRRVISHLVSLEGLDNIAVGDQHKLVGLTSLHMWDWTAIPPEHVDFADVMRGLAHNAQPLRVTDSHIESLAKPTANEPALTPGRSASNAWLSSRLRAGYTLKPWTTASGRKTMALFRGPLGPTIADTSSVAPWTDASHKLEVVDKETGMSDVSYSAAWSLGQAVALADRTFTKSLLRLRGNVTAEAVKRAKLRALGTPMDVDAYLGALKNSIGKLSDAHRAAGLTEVTAISRWHRTPEEMKRLPSQRLADVKFTAQDLFQETSSVMAEYAGIIKPAGAASVSTSLDPDWLSVRSWILDILYLARVPLHYLVPDPDSLPRESMRTFCIDPVWLESVIDGALSLANHFDEDDDVIRREIKVNLNKYLSTPIKDGPSAGTLPQIPKWGFLMRSIAVTAFPDLRVEAPLPKGSPKGLLEVLYMQLLADDVLVCFFDRCPGESTFDRIVITQPNHQQSFACGNTLTSDTLKMQWRYLPNQPNATLESLGQDRAKDVTWQKSDTKVPAVYHWESRTLLSTSFANQCIQALKKPGFFAWDEASSGVPSSIVASQLNRALLQLQFSVKNSGPVDIVPPALNTSTNPAIPGARQLYIPRLSSSIRGATSSSPADAQKSPPAAVRPLVSVGLPRGPRPPPPVVKHPKQEKSTSASSDSAQGENSIGRFSLGSRQGWYRRMALSCSPLTQITSKNQLSGSGLGLPQDIIFELVERVFSTAGYPYVARGFELIIPVRMASGETPPGVQTSLPTLLSLGGTLLNPVLPEIEPLNRGSCWLYDMRLVLTTSYDVWVSPRDPVRPQDPDWVKEIRDDGTSDKYTPRPEDKALQLMLLVRLQSRFQIGGEGNGRAADGTFLLKNAVVTTSAQAVDVQIDMKVWHNLGHDGAQSWKVKIASS